MEGPEGDEDFFEPGALAVVGVEHVVLRFASFGIGLAGFGARLLGNGELREGSLVEFKIHAI